MNLFYKIDNSFFELSESFMQNSQSENKILDKFSSTPTANSNLIQSGSLTSLTPPASPRKKNDLKHVMPSCSIENKFSKGVSQVKNNLIKQRKTTRKNKSQSNIPSSSFSLLTPTSRRFTRSQITTKK